MARRPTKYMRQVMALIARQEAEVRRQFLAAIDDVRSEAQLALIKSHLDRGDVDAAVAALALNPAMFAPFDEAIRAAYIEGGRATLAMLPTLKEPGGLGKLFSALTAGRSGRSDT